MLTLKAVNKAIAAHGIKAELVKGADFFYFTGVAVGKLDSTKVYVTRVNDLPLQRWLDELDGFIKRSFGTLKY
jgi:hypothetical protein